MKTTNNKKQGFTLIEVVLVLAIAGLIFLIVFLALPALQRSQRDTQRRNDVSRFMSQVTNYQSNNQGNVPTDDAGLTSFRDRYLTAGGDSFADPSTGSIYAVDVRSNRADQPAAEGTLFYFVDSKCQGETVIDGNGNRNVAVLTKLEGGSFYCQSN